ncbi:hypothetical protein DCC81_13950 [Chitinophaga parva]|uniref:Uncharacterized protein n=1 Tax=Chitinophaga parva TaxID=2169414 RepID=A0A2T7BGJ2_9BACT|nr:hypothetical protein [Chitinophaga parva]PUZ25394.1 hypothetical protein DCC81_13950 [Chitinophaga parva]
MGLDFLIFREGKRREVFELAEDLQKAIFGSIELATDSVLAKVRDYKSTVSLTGSQVTALLRELKDQAMGLAPAFRSTLQQVISVLEDDAVYKVQIAGA